MSRASHPSLEIDPDIRRAATMPAEVYASAEWHDRIRERVLARGWHLVADTGALAAPERALPCTLLDGCLGEPLVLTSDARGRLRCLSNVCTHRGNLVVVEAGPAQGLRCRYHGRRFGLDGKFVSMPEFEDVADFPTAADDLAPVPMGRLGPFAFASLDPAMPFDEVVAPVLAHAGAHLGSLAPAPERSRDYEVAASWMLYCDNYLEGFHIPFVHAALAAAVDYGSYRSELLPWGTLQIAEAKPGEDAFDAPAAGPGIAAYYFFLFPTTMLNFYPWGLSLNVVQPLGADRTRVLFRSYVRDASRLDVGAGADLHRVEMEDEAVVQAVQRGVRSRAYRRGRYSPSREQGVHHFHRSIARLVADGD
jgi:choline monooxygenase